MKITKNDYAIEVELDTTTTSVDELKVNALEYLPEILALAPPDSNGQAKQRVLLNAPRVRLKTWAYSLKCADAGKRPINYFDSFDRYGQE